MTSSANHDHTDTCKSNTAGSTTSSTSHIHESHHAAAITTALAALNETEREAVAQHIQRLAAMTEAKRRAVLVLTEADG